jgi:hypothetical protein
MKSFGLLNSLLLVIAAGAAMAQAEQRDALDANDAATMPTTGEATANVPNPSRGATFPSARFDRRTPAAVTSPDFDLEFDDRAGESDKPRAGALRRKAARAMR